MEKLKYNLQLVLGDWSHDGHNQTDFILLNTNLSKDEIKDAYALAIKKLGFDFTQEVCSEYEDNLLYEKHLDLLLLQGFKIGDLGLLDEYSKKEAVKFFNKKIKTLKLYTEEYLNIYLFIIKLGNPNFKYKIIEDSWIDIGGYGLYSS